MPPDSSNLQVFFRSDVGLYKDLAGTIAATADGDAIALWQDQSGNNNHLGQSGTNKPVLKLNQINITLPCVRYDGTSTYFNFSNAFAPTARTIYAVIRIPSSGIYTIICGDSGSLQWRMDTNKQRLVNAAVSDIGFGTNTMANNTWTQVNVSWDFTTGIFRMGGIADGSVTAANVGGGAWRAVGAHVGQAGEYFLTDMAAIMAYNTVHSTTTRQSVESYLTSIFGV